MYFIASAPSLVCLQPVLSRELDVHPADKGDAITYPKELASPWREPVVTLHQGRTVKRGSR
jgi:hypothetical protein